MASTASSPLAPFEYVLEADRNEEAPPTFKLRGLNGIEFMEVMADAKSDETGNRVDLTPQGLRTAIRYGLLGWQNFNDAEGNRVRFFGDMNKNLARLRLTQLTELAGQIIEASDIGEDDAKNS